MPSRVAEVQELHVPEVFCGARLSGDEIHHPERLFAYDAVTPAR
jgi:hypothetical protein